jgi:hypothetical protein
VGLGGKGTGLDGNMPDTGLSSLSMHTVTSLCLSYNFLFKWVSLATLAGLPW